ncbi:MAG: hypothetical protein ACREK8_11220 [Gemmatimonadales bacterium]
MLQRQNVCALAVIAAALLIGDRPAAAQGTIADRLRRIADDEKKSLVADANRQVNSAITDAAAAKVADGSFSAAFSPWASADGTKRVEIARYEGSAFAVTTSAGRQIVLCDDKGVLAWTASFTILDKAPPGSAGARGATTTPGGRGGGARGAGSPPVTPPVAASGGGRGSSGSGRGGTGAGRGTTGASDTAAGARGGSSPNADTAPSASQREFRLPSPQVTLTLPTTGPRTGLPGSGSVRVGDLSQDVFVGTARIRFAQATIPGERTPQVVDFGVAFNARVLPTGEQPAGCAVGNGGKTTVASGRGATPAARGTMPVSGSAADSTSAMARTPPAERTSSTPGASFAEGDVLTPKIATINLLGGADDSAKVSAVLKRGDELVYLGQEQNGYLKVSTGTSDGWVRKVLVVKH